MGRLFSKLRIGEKIGLSFGLVGLLFLAVIWQYHETLKGVLGDYERLHELYETRKTMAFVIESRLADVRQAEAAFLIEREERHALAVNEQVMELLRRTSLLAEVDEASSRTAERIRALTETYLTRFNAIAEAWRVKGLDHDSGLQGAFRDRVHELEDRAGSFKSGRLYVQLLQIRRGEKDLGLRREGQYRLKVRNLIDELRLLIEGSGLYPQVKEALLGEIRVYSDAFEVYAETVLGNGDIRGGKGPFRESAHRIEAILEAHHVPNLETNILQLRRREKDYLLRNDREYVRMVGEIARAIRAQVRTSQIAPRDKEVLTDLLDNYERDFLALVAQNDRITELAASMDRAAERITPLVKQNVEAADRLMAEKVAEIAEASRDAIRLNLLVVLGALALGVFSAVIITRRIVRPVLEMAGLLDRLTHESIVERIDTYPGSRDEVDAMAVSVNTMADHRAAFIGWWKASMDEAIALRDLNAATRDEQRDEAAEELRLAALSKVQKLNAIRGQLLTHAARVLEVAGRMRGTRGAGKAREDALRLEHTAQGIRTLLAVLEEDAPGRA